MPLPTGFEPRDLVAIIDANDQALAWVKDLAKVQSDSINNIPSHQLVPKLIGKEVIICYGEKHPAYTSHGDNTAIFDMFMELSEFGTNLEAIGSRPITPPVEHWKALGLRWSLGGSLIQHNHSDLADLEHDQLFATRLLAKVIETYDDSKCKLARGFLLNQKGSHSASANHYIAQLNEPLYAEVKARADLLKSSEPSPRKRPISTTTDSAPSQTSRAPPDGTRPSTRERGGANKAESRKIAERFKEESRKIAEKLKEESKEDLASSSGGLVQVVLPEVPKRAAAPGVLYPVSAIPDFNPDDFVSPSRLRAVQPAIFDTAGKPVLPSCVSDLLIPGTVVRIRMLFGAWKSTEGSILRPFMRAKDVYVIGGKDNGGNKPTEEKEDASGSDAPDSDAPDSDAPPSLLGAEEESPSKGKGKKVSHADVPKSRPAAPKIVNPKVPKVKIEPEDAEVSWSESDKEANPIDDGTEEVTEHKSQGKSLKKIIVELPNSDDEHVSTPVASTSQVGKREFRKRKTEEPEAGPSNPKKRKTTRATKE